MAGLQRILVVGYGSMSRGDDGLSPFIVEGLQDVAAGGEVDAQTVVLPQLDLTLAAAMSEVTLLIFVGARDDADAVVFSLTSRRV